MPIAKGKLAQIIEAAKQQLSPEEYARFERLVLDLQIHGLTPLINVELGKLMARLQWGLEVEESPEWIEALIKCDEAFLGYELRDMFYDLGIDPSRGHKKELCRELYMLGHPKVVEVMKPYLKEAEE